MHDLKEYDFELPTELIAQFPAQKRDESRLLVLERRSGTITDALFREIADFLEPEEMIVLNDTKVIPARLYLRRESGGRVEALFVRKIEQGRFACMHKGSGRLKKGERLAVDGGYGDVIFEGNGEDGLGIFRFDGDIESLLQKWGVMPLPPYIKRKGRELDELDRERYQTVFARQSGSIAAPTAGLHFTEEVFGALKSKGIEWAFVTLHVGIGTFKPVKSADIRDHRIDAEFYEISRGAAEKINSHLDRSGRVVACGTTVVRTLESAYKNRFEPSHGFCDLFIYPPFEFKVVSRMITNFHLPKSSLVMLVSAFAGRDLIMKAYREAVEKRYRFFSYGDAMLIL